MSELYTTKEYFNLVKGARTVNAYVRLSKDDGCYVKIIKGDLLDYINSFSDSYVWDVSVFVDKYSDGTYDLHID